MLSRKEMLKTLAGLPLLGSLGLKVNKEEMFGLYVAIKAALARGNKKQWQEWMGRTKYIASIVEAAPSVKGKMYVPEIGNHFSFLRFSWDQDKVKRTSKQVNEALMGGTPRIEAVPKGDKLQVAVVTLKHDQIEPLAYRLKEVLKDAVA